MAATSIKREAHQLVDLLPDEATWEDLMYRIYVRREVEAGLAESRAGQTVSVEEVCREFGLMP